MTERPERKMLLKYVHRSLVFIEVALLSASGRSKRPRGPTAVTGCSPGLFVCTGLAGDRHRGALGCGKKTLREVKTLRGMPGAGGGVFCVAVTPASYCY